MIHNLFEFFAFSVRTMIVTRPQDTEVELGQTTVIDCVVQHDPLVDVDVKWYHDDNVIDTTANTRRNLLFTGSLEIKNARPTDSGTYRCEVSSLAGGDTESASLVIIGKIYQEVEIFLINWFTRILLSKRT